MKNAQHAPGPWFQTYPRVICDASGVGIASSGLLSDEKRSQAEQEANARLIAAAPELLAALKRVEEIIRSGDDLSKESHYGQEHNQIRAAIAKATLHNN